MFKKFMEFVEAQNFPKGIIENNMFSVLFDLLILEIQKSMVIHLEEYEKNLKLKTEINKEILASFYAGGCIELAKKYFCYLPLPMDFPRLFSSNCLNG